MIDGHILGIICLAIGVSAWLFTIRLFFNNDDD